MKRAEQPGVVSCGAPFLRNGEGRAVEMKNREAAGTCRVRFDLLVEKAAGEIVDKGAVCGLSVVVCAYKNTGCGYPEKNSKKTVDISTKVMLNYVSCQRETPQDRNEPRGSKK